MAARAVVSSLVFDAKGRLLTGSDDGAITVWSLDTPVSSAYPSPYDNHPSSSSLSSSSSAHGSGMGQGTGSGFNEPRPYQVYQQHHRSIKAVNVRGTLQGHAGPVWSLDFKDDIAISGGYDRVC